MFLKVNTISINTLNSLFHRLTFILIFFLAGCGTTQQSSAPDRERQPLQPENSFLTENTIPANNPVYSVQLYPDGRTNSAPVIELKSTDQLLLTFETIGFESRSFRYYFTHHNPDGSETGLSPDQFIEGFSTSEITGGNVSQSRRPYYRQYQARFPNRNLQFRISGNYVLHVEDLDSGKKIFATPFFVFENEGEIRSSIETLRAQRQNLRINHRPISRYLLPGFVDQPQFDLTFYYTQNRFWGRTHKATEVDFSNPNEVRFETRSDENFVGDYEFRILNLRNLSSIRSNAVDIIEDDEITRVVLQDDAEGFTDPISLGKPTPYGASTSLNDRYLTVEFRFDADIRENFKGSLYLVGDFNQWAIDQNHKLKFDSNLERWKTDVIMKEGTYRYKYVFVEDSEIDDLRFDSLFQNVRQEYHAFVYFRDFNEFYTRLLQINTFYSR